MTRQLVFLLSYKTTNTRVIHVGLEQYISMVGGNVKFGDLLLLTSYFY